MSAELFATPATPLQQTCWTSQLVFVWDSRDVLRPGFSLELSRLHEVTVESGPTQETSVEVTGGLARVTLPAERGELLARVVKVGAAWELVAGAAAAVVVDGQQVSQRAQLADGARIGIGPCAFVYRVGHVIKPGVAHEHELYPPQPSMATYSGALATKHKQLALVALRHDVPVLVLGETGTGKERIARGVHDLSGRTGPFVAVNCGAMPASMVEATLFGHRKGAFTGAVEDRPGLLQSAHRGTLFLDEVGELPLLAQAALLRALQEGEVTPIGETRPTKVNVRLVAATNQDLGARVARGEFRQDLLARLSGYEFTLPGLGERMEDLGLIVRSMVRDKAPRRDFLAMTQNVARALTGYAWPRNIRELELVLTSALAQAPDGILQSPHLPDRLRSVPRAATSPVETPVHPARAPAERLSKPQLEQLLVEHGGNIVRVAVAAGVNESTIRRIARRYGIDLNRFRS